MVYLVLTLGSTGSALPTGLMGLGLTFCAWRRSGGQFNPTITLALFLLKQRMFRWTSLAFYILSHLVGAAAGAFLLLAQPPSPQTQLVPTTYGGPLRYDFVS